MIDEKDKEFLKKLEIPEELKAKVNLNAITTPAKEAVVEKLRKKLYKNNEEFRVELARIGNDLSGMHLENVDFTGFDLSQVILNSAFLAHAKFEGCNMVNAKLVFVDVRGANFKRAQLSRADLSISDGTDADFSHADLDFSNLSGSNLTRAKFVMAKLTMADLCDSNLIAADFSGADTFGMTANNCLGENQEEVSLVQYSFAEKQEFAALGGRSVYAASRSTYTGGSRYIGGSRYV